MILNSDKNCTIRSIILLKDESFQYSCTVIYFDDKINRTIRLMKLVRPTTNTVSEIAVT